MHNLSSRKHGIQGYLMIIGRQNLKTCPFLGKKSQKSQKKSKIQVVEVGNLYLTGYSLANRYSKANYTFTTIVHHVLGEKIQLF